MLSKSKKDQFVNLRRSGISWKRLASLNLNITVLFLLQLWEDAQLENIRLRDDLGKVRDDLKTTQKKLEDAIAVRSSWDALRAFNFKASDEIKFTVWLKKDQGAIWQFYNLVAQIKLGRFIK